MTKKIIIASIATAAALSMSGCAVSPHTGGVIKDQIAPMNATTSTKATKTGRSDECKSILGLVASGDCSVANAKKNGGITNVSSVDFESHNILGVIHTGVTIVKGN
ncbi:TRL-like family protein [Sulfurimonas sp.]|nr:TRL-like family protein [Sulfurimonas sp.]